MRKVGLSIILQLELKVVEVTRLNPHHSLMVFQELTSGIGSNQNIQKLIYEL
jgi:hypothetical protein